MSKILFPLRTNIKSLQRWGDNDISRRIKQSLVLYDEAIIETGTYDFQGNDAFVFQNYTPWDNEKNSEVVITKRIQEIENKQKDSYIIVYKGKTGVERNRYKIEKKDQFLADFRTVDVVQEIASGSFGKEVDFFQYASFGRTKEVSESIQ